LPNNIALDKNNHECRSIHLKTELEFGFKVSKRYLKGLAGFVADGMFKDIKTDSWKYTGHFKGYSMDLTGAAFLHRR
jgi:Glycosyl transferase family 64 domain